MRRVSLIATAVTFALFTVSSALASTVTYVTTWNGVGTTPAGVEVDGSGNVYVADIAGNRVLKYSSGGSLLQTIAPTEGEGALNSAVDVAIGPDGSIYASAAAPSEYVRKFASDGTYSNRWTQDAISIGIAADKAGNVYVQGVNEKISMYDAGGNFIDVFTGTGGNGVALNPSETIAYGFDLGNGLHAVDTTTGASSVLATLLNGSDRGAVAVNSVTGNIYVAERAGKVVQEFASNGTLIRNFNAWGAAGSGVSYSDTPSFGTIFGIAVDSGNNNIYVTDQSGKMLVFNEAVPEPSSIVLLSMGCFSLLAYAWRKQR
jgi:trimeric autotransporter adhesin